MNDLMHAAPARARSPNRRAVKFCDAPDTGAVTEREHHQVPLLALLGLIVHLLLAIAS